MADNAGSPAVPNPVVFFNITLGGKFVLCSACALHVVLPCLSIAVSELPHTAAVPLLPVSTGSAPSCLRGLTFESLSNVCPTGEPLGRIKMELFAHVTPKTAENFRQFCTGETKNGQGRPQGYKGCRFHRVVR